jgi:hypothetical protein
MLKLKKKTGAAFLKKIPGERASNNRYCMIQYESGIYGKGGEAGSL